MNNYKFIKMYHITYYYNVIHGTSFSVFIIYLTSHSDPNFQYTKIPVYSPPCAQSQGGQGGMSPWPAPGVHTGGLQYLQQGPVGASPSLLCSLDLPHPPNLEFQSCFLVHTTQIDLDFRQIGDYMYVFYYSSGELY